MPDHRAADHGQGDPGQHLGQVFRIRQAVPAGALQAFPDHGGQVRLDPQQGAGRHLGDPGTGRPVGEQPQRSRSWRGGQERPHVLDGPAQRGAHILVVRAVPELVQQDRQPAQGVLDDQFLLAGEVPEEGALGHPGRLGDVPDGRRAVALLGEQSVRSLLQGLPGGLFVRFTAAPVVALWVLVLVGVTVGHRAIGVAVGALGALTLVPALLGLAGRRIDRLRVRRPAAEASASHAGWARYAAMVGAHPWRFLLAGVLLLGVLAIPLLSLQLGHVDAGADPASYSDKQAYDAISSGFGPGASGPFTVVIQPGHGASGGQVQQLAGTLHTDLAAAPDVAAVSPVQASRDGAILVTTVVPGSRPQDQATDTLLRTLRGTTLPDALSGTGARGYVTGLTAEQLDFRNQVGAQLPVVIGVVLAAAFLLLLATFRSPLLAFKAAVLNLLSIGASYGVLVAVFQWGWGSSALGVSEKIPIESYVPMMMFAIVFGLSMDYEVFLLSRIREGWTATLDNHASVASGLAATARVITCAALIMASVFLSFLLSTNVVVKMLALGLGVSVLIDATVIRLIVVPATMFLLGRYNWWIPRWLDRALPHLEPEGPPARIRGRRRADIR